MAGFFFLRIVSLKKQAAQGSRQKKQCDYRRQACNSWLTATPPPDALNRSDGTRTDRLTCQDTSQVVGQSRCIGIAFPRFLLQALQADGFEVARQSRL